MTAVLDRPTVSAPPANGASATQVTDKPALRRLTVKQYDSMIEHGILTEYDRVELLNGLLINTMTKGSLHASANSRANRLFSRLLGEQVMVRIQDPIQLDDYSEPEPDLVLAAPDEQDYATRHPTPAEIFLVLEVSDSTLLYDRDDKGAAYARAGLRQFVLLNIRGRTVEDYREPDADGYRSKQTYTAGQSFNLVAFPDIIINVSDLLPPETSQE